MISPPLKGTLMIQGTGSHVGKSVLVAALCRIFADEGVRVAPFKAQNMALNSFITQEGGEIGRAQAFQALAAGIPPSVHMNPILLKPSSDTGSQVIVHGKVAGNMDAKTYHQHKEKLRGKVRESLEILQKRYDLIVIEGAGSPAEINLKEHDLVNMGAAKLAHAPVLLAGDIDRGGVFASLYGTVALLNDEERSFFRGMIINKFRGDPSLLEPGLEMISQKTGLPVLGVVPYFHDLYLPEEDSVGLRKSLGDGDSAVRIGVIRLSHISNFTDFDVLSLEPGVAVEYLGPDEGLDSLDAVILPGSKNTLTDLSVLRERGMGEKIRDFARRGKIVVGLCGGYQILGKTIRDPHHVESALETLNGLGLLDTETVLDTEKTTTLVKARPLRGKAGEWLTGYEIHMGVTRLGPGSEPLFEIIERNGRPCAVPDGAITPEGNVWGTYVHGIFDNDTFRHAFLNALRKQKGLPPLARSGIFYREHLTRSVQRLAAIVREALDMEKIVQIIREGVAT